MKKQKIVVRNGITYKIKKMPKTGWSLQISIKDHEAVHYYEVWRAKMEHIHRYCNGEYKHFDKIVWKKISWSHRGSEKDAMNEIRNDAKWVEKNYQPIVVKKFRAVEVK